MDYATEGGRVKGRDGCDGRMTSTESRLDCTQTGYE